MLEYLAIPTVMFWLVFLWIMVLSKSSHQKKILEVLPDVTIIIAVRNEEAHIEQLCHSLSALNYPQDKLEILIGNDASTDQTLKLLEKHKPKQAVLHNFSANQTGQFGKQKVISALANKAKGAYFIFTDGDMTFPINWIQGLLQYAKDEHALVVGVTGVRANGWFSKMQHLDWLFNENVVSWFTNIGIGLTAWGNNMLISKHLYDAVGGHETQPDAIVEDVALLRAVQSHGGQLVIAEEADSVAFTSPAQSVSELLNQRKRWMKGIKQHRLIVLLAAWFKIAFWPFGLYLSLINGYWMVALVLCLIARGTLHYQAYKLTKKHISSLNLLLFEVYDFVFYLITFAFYFLPIKIVWKGRKY